jgi:pimeloyl-ACP methyl ester carboxylesterase
MPKASQRSVTVDERRELVRGRSIAFRRSGEGPPLILLHGFTQDSRVWRPQLEDLPDEFDVIAWDAPGAGASADPTDVFTIADWADDLATLLDRLRVDRAHVLGLSWGGFLAQELYRRHERRVSSLVLADTYAGWKGSLPNGVAEQRLAAALRDSRLSPSEFVALYLPSMFSQHPPAKESHELARIMAEFHPIGFRLMAAALAVADTRDLLPTIRVPTLLIWGDQDARSPLDVAHQFHEAIPGSRMVVIPGAGHMSSLENPAAFNDHVRNFCRRDA